MDPRHNSYKRSTAVLPVCICKGDYCNTQEKIENIWMEQNIYRFHDPEDCHDKSDKERLTTKSVTSTETETTSKLIQETTATGTLESSTETTTIAVGMPKLSNATGVLQLDEGVALNTTVTSESNQTTTISTVKTTESSPKFRIITTPELEREIVANLTN